MGEHMVYMFVASYADDTDPTLDAGYYGPYASVEQAQEAARTFREERGIPGHENAQPTPEENEAWTNEGWTFGVMPLNPNTTPGTDETLAEEPLLDGLCPTCNGGLTLAWTATIYQGVAEIMRRDDGGLTVIPEPYSTENVDPMDAEEGSRDDLICLNCGTTVARWDGEKYSEEE